MSFPLALLSLLAELAFGYPDRLVRAIGHPVIWIGRLISLLDRTLNRSGDSEAYRRLAGILALAIIVSAAVAAAILVDARLCLDPVRDCRRRRRGKQPSGAAKPRRACRGSRHGARNRRRDRRAQGGLDDRRARSRAARRGRRVARRHREPGREFLRRRRRAGLLAGDRRPAGGGRLQGRQHRRQHDRPPQPAPSLVRLGVGALRRSDQPAGLAAERPADRRRGLLRPGRLAAQCLAGRAARRAQASLAQRRLAGGGDGRRARAVARRASPLWRRAGRRRRDGRRRAPRSRRRRHSPRAGALPMRPT